MVRPRAKMPWLLVAASLLFAAILFYVLFVGYLPAKKRAALLDAELKALYSREAQLQTQLAQRDQREAARDQQVREQMRTLTAERNALARRLRELEREVAAAKARPRTGGSGAVTELPQSRPPRRDRTDRQESSGAGADLPRSPTPRGAR